MLTQNYAALLGCICGALPKDHGYEKGFRDALESMALALCGVTSSSDLESAVATALDAYSNNTEETEFINGRVLVSVLGGVAEFVCDDGIEVIVFDHDNYSDDPENTDAAPVHYADLAAQASVPVLRP